MFNELNTSALAGTDYRPTTLVPRRMAGLRRALTAVLLSTTASTTALNNGLCTTPPMGYNVRSPLLLPALPLLPLARPPCAR